MSLALGLDLGTSSLKLSVIDENGNLLAENSQEYPLEEAKPGWREIDPQKWLDALKKGIEVLSESVDIMEISSIGITGQMHTLVLVDENMKPVRPAVSWNDTRSKNLLDDLKSWMKDHQRISQLPCISAGSPAASLCWIAENEPEALQQSAGFLIGSDFISSWLSGKRAVDACMASTSGLYDLQSRKWDYEFLRTLNLASSFAPEVVPSGRILGNIRSEAAQWLRLNPDAVIVEGTGDNPAGAFAAKLFEIEKPMISLGTSGVVQDIRHHPDYSAKGKNVLFELNNGSRFCLRQGTVQSCGQAYAWINRTVLSQSITEADQNLDPEKPLPQDFYYFPHLTGEKTLFQDPELKGAFLNLTPSTGRDHLVQGVMEGIAFGLRELIEQMDIQSDEFLITGGGANSRVWRQIIADVTGRKITLLKQAQSPSAAMGALSMQISPADQNRVRMAGSTCFPNPDLRQWYDRKYEGYRLICPALQNLRALQNRI